MNCCSEGSAHLAGADSCLEPLVMGYPGCHGVALLLSQAFSVRFSRWVFERAFSGPSRAASNIGPTL